MISYIGDRLGHLCALVLARQQSALLYHQLYYSSMQIRLFCEFKLERLVDWDKTCMCSSRTSSAWLQHQSCTF